MNNKEFTSELSRRLGYNTKDTSDLITTLLSDIIQELQEGNAIGIQGFGAFEVKKKAERCHQSCHQTTLVGSTQTGVGIQAKSNLKG